MDTSGLKKFAQEARRTLRELITAKLDLVLSVDSAARREFPTAVKQLESEIAQNTRDRVIEKVAYTWFNRFSALRFMDANGYTDTRVLSPADGQTRPELLSEAMAGVIGDEVPEGTKIRVRKLLDGTLPSSDPQGEAYRLLVVALCNHWHGAMPFMFEKIADYTELLMPDDLLSASNVVAKLRDVMTEEACQDVEIIGWLYQFYISEKKDQVFAALKKNVKVTPENIPAATQLFTPHWIVRYLVENSLGRLWLLNRPSSKLAAQMDYYIAPKEAETDFLRIGRPEEIRICDPACGSGHMLTYAFDLLYAIYEEEGYDAVEIPALILTHNLHGVEIDDRAGALAAFALVMKAAAKLGRRRFLRLAAQPNICVLQDVSFTPAEMQDVVAVVGRDLFTDELQETLGLFVHAKNFGSLIVPKLRDPSEVARVVGLKDFGGDLLLRDVRERVLSALHMAEALSPKYHLVVANPPYMSRSNMNNALKAWAEKTYPEGKHDLFAAFIMRSLTLSLDCGFSAFVTIQNWMFLSSFEDLRDSILKSCYFGNLIQIGYNSFPELNSKVVQAVAFILGRSAEDRAGEFINLNDAPQSADKHLVFRDKRKSNDFYSANSTTFKRLPGEPIAYWVSDKIALLFKNKSSGDVISLREGIHTGDNERFLRFWHEANWHAMALACDSEESVDDTGKWVPYNKGGTYRKWYGNNELVIAWDKDSRDEMQKLSGHVRPSKSLYFKEGGTWSALTSGYFGIRYYPPGHLFDSKGQVAVGPASTEIIGQFNTKLFQSLAKTIMPTLDYKCGDVKKLPFLPESSCIVDATKRLIQIGKSDWDTYETSWDFTALLLLSADHRAETLEGSYVRLRTHWQEMTEEMQRLEEANNRIFIDAHWLQDELTPEIQLGEITLTCNPAYRYGGKATEAELEERLRADTMAEFLHYAVGCMLGRYSLDAPGLILANQGEGIADYLARVPNPGFAPDIDNVIPVLDGDWFADDISERFREFLRLTFGEAHFQENLAFIEESLSKDIRKYFTRDFFNDHVKRYKKRPIYWLFSSPKGTFNALIYMHRYTPDTVNVVLNDYLRVFRSKLEAHKVAQERMSINANATAAQRTAAIKDIQSIAQQIVELDDWERDVVYPMATRRIEIDLDDGVKANYPKFASALKPIKGLEEVED
jgi:hypothetical protein